MKNVALIITGFLRSFIDVFPSIQSNLIDSNPNHKFDIYLHYSVENDKSKYNNDNLTIDCIQRFVKCKSIIFDGNIQSNKQGPKHTLYCQNYKLYITNSYKNQTSFIENINYDIVFRIRPDVYLHSKIFFDDYINEETIYLPENSNIDKQRLTHIDDPHICDILAFGSNSIMNKYCDFFCHVQELTEKHGCVNETLLWHYLTNNNIPIKKLNINYTMVLSKCFTIAISGDSASGKSNLSNFLLKNYFKNGLLLECDRYHKWERNDENWSNFTHLNPDANYLLKMQQDVFDLKLGKNIFQVDYDHKTGKFTEKKIIQTKKHIIVCGLHSLYLNEHITDLKIYMDTEENIRKYWKIERDMKKRCYTKEDILQQIENRTNDFYKYVYPQKQNADIIINIHSDKFDLNNVDDLYLHLKFRIGIRNCFNISHILKELSYNKQIKNENPFIYLYFSDFENLYDTLINILKQLKRY